MKIFLLILWIIYSITEGKRDGSYFHSNNTSSNPVKENLHWLFSIMRAVVLTLITIVTLYAYPNQIKLSDIWNLFPDLPLMTTIFISGLSLMFSFLHNGLYYMTRNKLDSNEYPKGFSDSSTTSTSFIELDFKTRTIFFIIGIIGIVTTLSM